MPRPPLRIYTSQDLRSTTYAITSRQFANPARACTASGTASGQHCTAGEEGQEDHGLPLLGALAMPFSINFGPNRRAVVELDPEVSDVATQTAIGLIATPTLCIYEVCDATKYISRREAESFLKRRRKYQHGPR